jgi:tyrosine-specific transport protein
MSIFRSHGHVLGGAFLIAGTTIGVGMLALPVATGPGGFLPSILIYFLCWAFMLCTGLLLLEVCSWMPQDTNLISMASRFLGKPGKFICWAAYLFLFELVMVAHIVGGGTVTSAILSDEIHPVGSMVIYVILFAPLVYLGARIVDRVNLIIFSGVLLSYIAFILVSASHIRFELLEFQDWSKAWFAIPILFTAFTYQVIIPTLMNYMNRDTKKVRKAILFGTSIPLVVYVIWQVLILGIVPVEGPNGLIEAAMKGENAVQPLRHFVNRTVVLKIGETFAFFTMTASYIALALAFFDFLADGLKVKKKGINKLWLSLLVFVPPLSIGMTYPHLFLTALGYAGGISCAILFGLYPPLMVWVGRYKMGLKTGRQIGGGRLFLALLVLFIVIELGLELIPQFR